MKHILHMLLHMHFVPAGEKPNCAENWAEGPGQIPMRSGIQTSYKLRTFRREANLQMLKMLEAPPLSRIRR